VSGQESSQWLVMLRLASWWARLLIITLF